MLWFLSWPVILCLYSSLATNFICVSAWEATSTSQCPVLSKTTEFLSFRKFFFQSKMFGITASVLELGAATCNLKRSPIRLVFWLSSLVQYSKASKTKSMIKSGFLRCFRDPIRVSRIGENYHRVPRIRENYQQVPRIREIGSLRSIPGT